MATKRTRGRGRSAVSGLVGGADVVAGQKRRGSAGGPVSRKKRSKRITEQPKSTGKEPIEETTRAKRDRARADYNTRVAADPSNPARLRPSERTPNKTDVKKKAEVKFKTKKPTKVFETSDYAKGKHKHSTAMSTTHDWTRAKKKADAVRKRMAKKKDSY